MTQVKSYLIYKTAPTRGKLISFILWPPFNNNYGQNSHMTCYVLSQCCKYFRHVTLFNPHKKRGKYYYYTHCSSKETKTERNLGCLTVHSATKLSPGLKSGSLKSGFMLFIIILLYALSTSPSFRPRSSYVWIFALNVCLHSPLMSS